MGYDVFISYSHGGDDLLSERVQDALTKFAKPWYRRRALNVFRDRTALSANPGLWSSIAESIDDSRYFLFLASPDAATSVWCSREVEHWRAKHGSDGLLVLLTDGEILWDEETNDFDWASDDGARRRVRRRVSRRSRSTSTCGGRARRPSSTSPTAGSAIRSPTSPRPCTGWRRTSWPAKTCASIAARCARRSRPASRWCS